MTVDDEEHGEQLSEITPHATICSSIAGVGNNYNIMPNIFRDNDPIPGATSRRYCVDYWDRTGGPYRFGRQEYKTQEDLDREREARTPKVTIEIKGNLKWTQEEAIQYLEEKAEVEARAKKRVGRKPKQKLQRSIDEIYWADRSGDFLGHASIERKSSPSIRRFKGEEIEDLLCCHNPEELQGRFKKLQAKYDADQITADEAEEWYKFKRGQEKSRRVNG